MIKEALQYVCGLAKENEKTEVLTICGKTYANRNLTRYDSPEKARPLEASSLSAMVDYISSLSGEFPEGRQMIIHIVSPKEVRLLSSLDAERGRECLFVSSAVTSEYRFGQWYDQEEFMVALQSNFDSSDDLRAVMRMAGNIEKKNNQSYSDDGISQVATITMGAATKADALVPNPVTLFPYRTFQEVTQPASEFVFRISNEEVPRFKIVEAQGGLWKNQAADNIRMYFNNALADMPEEIAGRIVIIG